MLWAFDFGTSTGYSIMTLEGKVITSGCINLQDKYKEKMYSEEFYRAVRFNALLEFLDRLEAELGIPETFIFEKPIQHFGGNKGGSTSDIIIYLNTFAAFAAHWCYSKNIEPVSVAATTLKKWATQNGHAKKEVMLIEANKRFRGQAEKQITNHNEADALLLAAYALDKLYTKGC